MNKVLHINLTIAFCLLFSISIYSQCLNKVFQSNGTHVVNNVTTTISSSGSVLYGNHLMCTDTNVNYFIGYESIEGSYTFNFSPAVESVSMNFYRIDNNAENIDEVQLFVNGTHYFITSPGSPTGCAAGLDSPLAIINAAGNISASPSLLVGSMKNLTINGPIQTLTVLNHIVSGLPYGSFFELYICNPVLSDNEFESHDLPIVAPNPFSDKLEINLPNNNGEWSVVLTNLHGVVLKSFKNVSGNLIIYRDDLSSGVYLLHLQNDKQRINKKIIVKD